MKRTCLCLCWLFLVFAPSIVSASFMYGTPYDVYAMANSSSGGTGLATISLTAGQGFTVAVNPSDLWNAGALPRWSNANGLTGVLYATGSDASGQPTGTLIGTNYGTYSQGNLSVPYGSLVGQIGSGDYFLIGTNFTGKATTSGTLNLYYWDSNNGDNSGHITAYVSATPLPSALLLLGPGLAGLGLLRKKFAK